MFDDLRKELHAFYLHDDAKRAKAFADKCFAILDARFREGMTVTAQKLLQYDVICEEFEPVVFRHSPYFYETGVLTSLSDGARNAKGHPFAHANGWVYKRNAHLFAAQDPALYERRKAHTREKLYLICGPYNDTMQHFNFNCRPFLQMGAAGIYQTAQAALADAQDGEDREFLQSVCHGMVTLRRMAEKFAEKAGAMLLTESDEACRANLRRIADTARRVPWEAPKTF